MSRIRFVVLSLILVLICGSTWVVASPKENKQGDSLTIPLGTLELTPPEDVEAKKSSVEFPHSRHFSYNCQECHHTWDFSADLTGCKTSGCHDQAKAPEKSENPGDVAYFKKAYHQKCIGCHKAIKAINAKIEKNPVLSSKNVKLQKAGPTSCRQCHPKE